MKRKIKNLKFKIKNYCAGFTLLELLVSIAIISLLIGLGSVSYTTAQKKSRDAKRKGDLKSMQNALEQFYADNSGNYPTNPPFSTIYPTYLNDWPVDPKTGSDYENNSLTEESYCYCSYLEGESKFYSICLTATPSPPFQGQFCVSNLQ